MRTSGASRLGPPGWPTRCLARPSTPWSAPPSGWCTASTLSPPCPHPSCEPPHYPSITSSILHNLRQSKTGVHLWPSPIFASLPHANLPKLYSPNKSMLASCAGCMSRLLEPAPQQMQKNQTANQHSTKLDSPQVKIEDLQPAIENTQMHEAVASKCVSLFMSSKAAKGCNNSVLLLIMAATWCCQAVRSGSFSQP